MEAGRRDPQLPGPDGHVAALPPETKVVEIESVGLRVRNTKRFKVLNPTSISYEFSWEFNGPGTAARSPFTCQTPNGHVAPGRRYEIAFSFTAVAEAVAESFWTFSIPSQNIHVPFLVVGHVL